MTLGELARYDEQQLHLHAPLTVVAMKNWQRGDWYDSTGLTWIDPSPNLRNVEEATLYPALGLIETTNISVGRGTDTPFEWFGAPWIDGRKVASYLNRRDLPGVRFYAASLTPEKPYPYRGSVMRGRADSGDGPQCAGWAGVGGGDCVGPAPLLERRLQRAEDEPPAGEPGGTGRDYRRR